MTFDMFLYLWSYRSRLSFFNRTLRLHVWVAMQLIGPRYCTQEIGTDSLRMEDIEIRPDRIMRFFQKIEFYYLRLYVDHVLITYYRVNNNINITKWNRKLKILFILEFCQVMWQSFRYFHVNTIFFFTIQPSSSRTHESSNKWLSSASLRNMLMHLFDECKMYVCCVLYNSTYVVPSAVCRFFSNCVDFNTQQHSNHRYPVTELVWPDYLHVAMLMLAFGTKAVSFESVDNRMKETTRFGLISIHFIFVQNLIAQHIYWKLEKRKLCIFLIDICAKSIQIQMNMLLWTYGHKK